MEDFLVLDREGKYEDLLIEAKTQTMLDSNDLIAQYWFITSLWRLGRIDESLEIAEKYEMQFEKAKHTQKELYLLHINRLGTIYQFKGKLDTALEYYQKCMKLSREAGNSQLFGGSQCNIGLIASVKGDLDIALEYYLKCLKLYEESGFTQHIPGILNNIANLFRLKGEFDTAIEYCHKSLRISRNSGHVYLFTFATSTLIEIYFDQDNREKAKFYLDELSNITKGQSNKLFDLFHRYYQARYLKSSSRILDKAKAQELFDLIVKDDVIDIEITLNATDHLIELLLIELKIYGEEAVLDEISDLISNMYKLSQKERMYATVIQALLLKSKLAIIHGNLDEAINILDQAVITAEERGLNMLLKRATKEQKQMREDFVKLQEFIDNNNNMSARIDRIQIIEYIKKSRAMIEKLDT